MPKLRPTELEELRELIVNAYPTEDDLDEFLLLNIGPSLAELTKPARLPLQVLWMIRKAESDGWLSELMAAMVKDKPGVDGIQAFAARLVPPSCRHEDPYQAHVFGADWILINRRELRSAVRDLEEHDAFRFLVVTGGEKTGKTYSRHFIMHVSACRQTFRPGWVDLVDLHDSVRGPLKPEPVVGRIFSHLGLSAKHIPPKSHEKYERWSQRVCDVLLRKLLSKNAPRQPIWLVIDGFNSVPVDDGTIAFVQELARQIESSLTNLRLVLLGWSGQLPRDAEHTARRETLTPLSDDDLCDFFEKVHRRRGPALDERSLAREVAASLAATRRAAHEGMSGINAVLGQAAEAEWRRLENRP